MWFSDKIYKKRSTNLKIEADHNYIMLKDFLKVKSVINSGGEAKYFLTSNEVLVNGEKENRRGRKLYPGDIVKIGKTEYKI